MEIGNTSGFYKLDSSNTVMCGQHFIYGPQNSFELYREQKDIYIYPIDGWYWFDSEELAYNFFEIEWYPEIYTMGLPKPWLNNTI